jgi:hypothetical protein
MECEVDCYVGRSEEKILKSSPTQRVGKSTVRRAKVCALVRITVGFGRRGGRTSVYVTYLDGFALQTCRCECRE